LGVLDQPIETYPAQVPVWPQQEAQQANYAADKRKRLLLRENQQEYVPSRVALGPAEQRVSQRPITKTIGEVHHRRLAELEEEQRLVDQMEAELMTSKAKKQKEIEEEQRRRAEHDDGPEGLFGPTHLDSISNKFGRPRMEAAVKSFTAHHNSVPTPDHKAFISPLQRCQHAAMDPTLITHPLFKSRCMLCYREQKIAEELTREVDYTFLDGLKQRNGPTADVMWAKIRRKLPTAVQRSGAVVGMADVARLQWKLQDAVQERHRREAIEAVQGVKVLLNIPDDGRTYELGWTKYGRYI
jgi:hypothetical protein